MLPKESLLLLPTIAAAYGYLKINKTRKYKYLEKIQKDIINNCKLDFSPYNPDDLPAFTDRIITIPNQPFKGAPPEVTGEVAAHRAV